jgi:cytochrome P450
VTDRVATEDCENGGKAIERGQLVAAVLGAANRDPEQFPDPDRLDLGRIDNRHLAFGWGPHFCLGAALARAEAQIAFATLLRRFPELGGDPTASAWRPSMVLRGLTRLPLSLGQPARRAAP